MHKIFIIFKREYLTRVKNRTFILMTLLGPILMAVFYSSLIWVATRNSADKEARQVILVDESGFFAGKVDSFGNYHFKEMKGGEKELIGKVTSDEFDAMLQIRDTDVGKLDSVNWISKKTLSLVQSEKLQDFLSEKVYASRLATLNIQQRTIDSLKPVVNIQMIETDSRGELKSSSTGLKSGIGFALAFLIYMFIFIYGAMVMRSTLEEKTNRIVEVIVSSVKPFQMMMGKILGVAAVGLTQFVAWLVLGALLIFGVSMVFSSEMGKGMPEGMSQGGPGMQGVEAAGGMATDARMDILNSLQSIPFGNIILIFLVFFIGGYLLYSSMFAAIGSAVSQDSDVQQFMLPISLPLIFGFVIAQSVVFQDPHGTMAVVFSMIPFTSPIVMAVRAPFGVPPMQILGSFLILAATFVFFVWLSGRIYRVGILMYGKKPTWRELGKWIFIKD